jgi:hypothetical protein
VLGLYYKNVINRQNVMPAAVASIQTFGDFLNFNPHLHIICADGCFGTSGTFYAAGASLNAEEIEPLFRHKVLSMLKKKIIITDRTIELISSWRHSGFNVYCTERIYTGNATSMENLARYIIRASFSQERMSYVRQESMVIYKSKDGKNTKEFDGSRFFSKSCQSYTQ